MKKAKYLLDKDPWVLAEDIPDIIDFFFPEIWLSSFANNLQNSCGQNYKKILAVFSPNFSMQYYYGKKDSLAMEKYLVNKIKTDPKFGREINTNIIKWSDRLRQFASRLTKVNIKKLSNRRLAEIIRESDGLHTHLYEWGWLSNASDMFNGIFTDDLKNYTAKKIKPGQNLNEIFIRLTAPTAKSVAAIEEEGLLKIAALIKSKANQTLVKKLIARHHAKYYYLKYLWLGSAGTYSQKYYYQIAKKMARSKSDPKSQLLKIKKELLKIKEQKSRLFKELRIDWRQIKLFSIYSDFMLTKIYRRYAQIYWAYQMGMVLKEIAGRLGINFNEVRYLTAGEIIQALKGNHLDRWAVSERLNFCWLYLEKGIEIISTDRDNQLLDFLKRDKKNKAGNLVGQIGCLGKASGRVKIINSQKDIIKMKPGDILVSVATNPDLVPAMKKAAAIITEQGGVTSHAAIVSRELNIPCVIGTKIATKVLQDGDLVEVDATKGVVKKL